MENCCASRISGTSAVAGASRPSIAALPAIALKTPLKRMAYLPSGACYFFLGQSCKLSNSLDFGNTAVPVEDLLAVPVQHAVVLVHVVVNLLEIFDPVRLPADVGMD